MKLSKVEFAKPLSIAGVQAVRWEDKHGWELHLHAGTQTVTLIHADHPPIILGPVAWTVVEALPLAQDASAPPVLTETTPLDSEPVLEAPSASGRKRKVIK